MQSRHLIFFAVTMTCLAALFGGLWANETIFSKEKLIGDWQYSFRENFYPKYTSRLTLNDDETFTKIEKFQRVPNGPTVISRFKGLYRTGKFKLEPGSIAFIFHDATARLDDEIVAVSPEGGYTTFCKYGFSDSGALLISEPVDARSGHAKDPQKIATGRLLPSWESYSRIK